MMSSAPDSNNNIPRKPTVITSNTQTSSGTRKPGSSPKPPDNQQALKCPRCDSPNTKFCYYNNYSLTQPRHFCKTCRRYWTKGGALRNVPIGGGCRKNKKTKSSSTSLSFSTSNKQDYSFDTDGFKLFHGGFSPSFDQFDQFGRIPFSRLSSSISSNGVFNNNNNHHQLVSFGDLSASNTTTTTSVNPSCFDIDAPVSSVSLMGSTFNHHLGAGSSSSSLFKQGDQSNSTTTELFNGGGGGVVGGLAHHHQHQDMGSILNVQLAHHHNTTSNNLASTMESLSSINQELHWKLQQERLSMLFGGGDNQNTTPTTTTTQHNINQNKEISSTSVSSVSGDLLENQITQKPLPISFQNLDISKQQELSNNLSRKGDDDHHHVCSNGGINEWSLFENSYNSTIPTTTTTTTTTNSSSWKGIQAWSDHLQNYSDLQ